jgi:hypothetical protein
MFVQFQTDVFILNVRTCLLSLYEYNGLKGRLHVCDYAYESPYDSVYDFLQRGGCYLIFNLLFLISVDKQL